MKRRQTYRGHIYLGWRQEVRYSVGDLRRWLARRWKRWADGVYEWIWP